MCFEGQSQHLYFQICCVDLNFMSWSRNVHALKLACCASLRSALVRSGQLLNGGRHSTGRFGQVPEQDPGHQRPEWTENQIKVVRSYQCTVCTVAGLYSLHFTIQHALSYISGCQPYTCCYEAQVNKLVLSFVSLGLVSLIHLFFFLFLPLQNKVQNCKNVVPV